MMGLGSSALPAWSGTGWLVTLTVLWVIASLWTALWYGAMMMDPEGMSLPDGLKGWVYGIGAILTVYVEPLLLGWAAYTRSASLWVCLLYLVPHVLTVAVLVMLYLPSQVRRWTGG